MKEPVSPIAIIGFGLRLPGSVSTGDDLWQLIVNKKNAKRRVPESRYNVDSFKGGRGAVASEYGYFIDHVDLEAYDASLFPTNQQQVQMQDPQQRLLQEVVWECLENAGATHLRGTNTGVFVGSYGDDWNHLLHHDTENINQYRVLNGADFILSNGLSYQHDFRGPSMTIRAACSASMTALHLACQALRAGDCPAAVVAGCSLMMAPYLAQDMSAQGLLAKDGLCKTFSELADGYARADGVNAVLIKPLADAIRDNDPIRAVIRSTAVGADGKTTNFGVPSPMCQEAMIRHAYQVAGIDDVSKTAFVECHGTGTAVGDPLEMEAVGKVWGEQGIFCGSIKPNIGHTEGASGLTGIIKAVLSLEHEIIPPNLLFGALNPKIAFEKNKLKVPLEPTPWPEDRYQRISVNSFGIGGANSHVILDSAKSFGLTSYHGGLVNRDSPASADNSLQQDCDSSDHKFLNPTNVDLAGISCGQQTSQTNLASELRLLPVSAACELSVKKRAVDLQQYAKDTQGLSIERVAYTLGNRRTHLPYRTFCVAHGLDDEFEFVPPRKANVAQPPKVAFVFTGQGAQWLGMGKSLYESISSFRNDIEQMDSVLQSLEDPPSWTMAEFLILESEDIRKKLLTAQCSQPLVTALQVALVNLLSKYSIRPDAVTGHSSGEIAAAYAAGALTMREAIICSYIRGFSVSLNSSSGGMMFVGMGRAAVLPHLLARTCVACENSPSSITLSGDLDALEKVASAITAHDENTFIRKVKVDQPYHSPYMAEAARLAETLLKPHLRAGTASIPYYSATLGSLAPQGTTFGPSYWRENIQHPVLFNQAMQAMLADFKDSSVALVEIGPHAALQGPIRQIMLASTSDHNATYIPTLIRGKDAVTSLLATVGHLYCQGSEVNFSAMNPTCPVSTDLPLYPWNHTNKYWNESRLSKEWRMRNHPHHELLGSQHSVNGKESLTWRNLLRLDHVSWLQDHKVMNGVVFPFAGFIAMIGEAVRQVTGLPAYRLKNVVVKTALLVPDSETTEIITNLTRGALTENTASSWYEVSISSVKGTSWTQHCVAQAQGATAATHVETSDGLLPRKLSSESLYQSLDTMGVSFGPCFRLLHDISACTNDSHARATVANETKEQPAQYATHPAIIDALLQLSIVAGSKGLLRNLTRVRVPTRVGHVYIGCGDGAEVVADASERSDPSALTPTYDAVALATKPGEREPDLVAKLGEVTFTVLNTGDEASDLDKAPTIARCEWKNDIEFCKIQDLLQPGKETRLSKIELEKLTALCILCLLDGISMCESTPRTGYLDKYVSWLLAEKESMIRGEYSIVKDARRWAGLDAEARNILLKKQRDLVEQVGGAYLSAIANMEYSIAQPDNINAIFSGNMHALQILLEGGGLTAWYNNLGLQLDASAFFRQLVHSQPNLKILELGAGTGGTTETILNTLCSENGTRMYAGYTYTDISSGFFTEAKKRFEAWDGIEYKILDISKDPSEQGFEASQYDLVVASNVLHATPSLLTTLANVRSLLRPGGRLYFQEIIEPSFTRTIPFIAGFLPGWWLGESDGRPDRANVSVGRWDKELRNAGFGGVEAVGADDDETYQEMAHIVAVVPSNTSTTEKVALLYHRTQTKFAIDLASSLEASGITVRWCSIEQPDFQQDGCDIISTVDLASPHLKDISEQDFKDFMTFMSNLEAGCLWLTRAAQISCTDPSYAIMIGLARTARAELNIDFWTLELQHADSSSVTAATSVAKKFLARERGAGRGTNCEYAVHEGAIQIGRYDWASVATEAKSHFNSSDPKHITVAKPGILDSITWVQSAATALGADEVEVSIRSVGLNFRDVMVSMGILQGISGTIGYEAAGVVTAAGCDVGDIKVGDRVVTMSHGLFTTSRVLKANTVTRIPETLTFDEAATMTLAYGTALYALVDKGGLRKGQTVLIHAASGGVGQAAIQVCRMVGAEIYVTVGSEEKVQYLQENFNVPQARIFHSRSASFYDDVMAATNGKGVDLVLNSLSGELLHASWRCVAKWGTMLEIGKRDMVEKGHLPLDMFENNRSFCGINLDTMFEVPEMLQSLIARVLSLYVEGHIKPIQHRRFEAQHIVDAFRYMQKGQHIGKIVISLPEQAADIPSTASSTVAFSSASTYLLVGGLGGLGRVLATWMVDRGARRLLFLSRSAESPEHEPFLQELRSQGCQVIAVAGSVEEKDDIAKAISKASSPISGVAFLSAVIRDRPFSRTSYSDWRAVQGPKVTGTYNLHEAFCGADLDFFLLFGSTSAVTGQPGQMSYSAANAYLSSFVQYRQGLGLPCSVINLGAVSDLGVFGKSGLQRQFDQLGMKRMTENEFLEAVQLSIAQALSRRRVSATRDAYRDSSELTVGLQSSKSLDDPENMHATRLDVRFGLARQITHAARPAVGVQSSGISDFILSIKNHPEVMDQPETLAKVTREIGLTLCRLMIMPEDLFEPAMTLDSMGVDSLCSNWPQRRQPEPLAPTITPQRVASTLIAPCLTTTDFLRPATMYEDAWYSFVPETTGKNAASNNASHGHKRKESLLQQPYGTGKGQQTSQSIATLAEDLEEVNGPPEASVLRRAASYADCRHAQKAGHHESTRNKQSRHRNRHWDALILSTNTKHTPKLYTADLQTNDTFNEQLVEASQQEYLLYRDQLSLTERHLDGLINDANATLELLTKLSNSFQSVETQTSTFQAQCEEVLTEQTRLEKLADEVGTDYYYYSYLDNATRRLNAPGAGRLVDDESFGEMVENIDACVAFMENHETYRERDSYLARYNALLTKCLHLLDHGFNTRLEKVSSDIARQLSATKSESTRHALAYGRFEEMLTDSYALLPNIHKATRRVYDQYGRFDSEIRNSSIFSSSTLSMIRTYLTTRDRDVKMMTLHDVEEYQKGIKDLSLETASRNYIKQTLERVHNENSLFFKVFNIEPSWNTAHDSVFQSIKMVQTTMVHPGNLQPMATQLQTAFQAADIQSVCKVVGWIANEYGIVESDEDEEPIAPKQYREYAARLLVEHLWPFVDNAFETEISKSITKAAVADEALRIGPVVDGVSSSNAFPLVQKGVELLRMFDRAMPKERSSQNSQVVFRVVRETILVLQQASSRIQSQKINTDADLFMVKNLLIIKNELLSLEIGDIRSQPQAMQHFGQMWETLSPQNLVGIVGNILGGQLWSSRSATPSVTAKTLTVEDMNEQLDELLRQSIYGFTKRWAGRMQDAESGRRGAKPLAAVEAELETMLQTAFSNQPEVIGKLKEAIAFYEEDTAARSGKR